MNWLDWVIVILLAVPTLDGLRKGDGCLGGIIKGAISLLMAAIVIGALLWGMQWFNARKTPLFFPEAMEGSVMVGHLNRIVDGF